MGFVTKPTFSRANRSMQQFFVNGRPVRSRLLGAAVEQAYQGHLTSGRFPADVYKRQVIWVKAYFTLSISSPKDWDWR